MNWLQKTCQVQGLQATIMSLINGQIDVQKAAELLRNSASIQECCIEVSSASVNGTSQQAARSLNQLRGLLGCVNVENPVGRAQAQFSNQMVETHRQNDISNTVPPDKPV